VDVVLGIILVAAGVFLIVRRQSQAESWVRQRNQGLAFFRMKRRYGERELRHNVRAAAIVGAFAIAIGVLMIADINM
jgi:uncharacterized membrane protein HdeD (DUF308 family)